MRQIPFLLEHFSNQATQHNLVMISIITAVYELHVPAESRTVCSHVDCVHLTSSVFYPSETLSLALQVIFAIAQQESQISQKRIRAIVFIDHFSIQLHFDIFEHRVQQVIDRKDFIVLSYGNPLATGGIVLLNTNVRFEIDTRRINIALILVISYIKRDVAAVFVGQRWQCKSFSYFHLTF